MKHHVTYKAELDYVSIALCGEVSTDDLVDCRAEAVSLLQANSCKRLLVDATQEAPRRDVTDDFHFTSEHASQFPLGTRHAVLVQVSEQEYMKFVENVARNRGVDMYLFIDRDHAMDWLLDR